MKEIIKEFIADMKDVGGVIPWIILTLLIVLIILVVILLVGF